jgi:hypothetical protein
LTSSPFGQQATGFGTAPQQDFGTGLQGANAGFAGIAPSTVAGMNFKDPKFMAARK